MIAHKAPRRRMTQATRPFAMRSAGTEKSSTSIVPHVGRRSGRIYETPVIAVEHEHGFLINRPCANAPTGLKTWSRAGKATLVTQDGVEAKVDVEENVIRIQILRSGVQHDLNRCRLRDELIVLVG